METIDCLVIGAGVIGLAVARAIAQTGREVVIVEQEAGIGTGISSRNSEVIHAGLYYSPGLEPALRCTGALYSPSSGILDSHAFMLSLQGDAEHANATFAFRSAVVAGRTTSNGIDLTVEGDRRFN